MKYLAHIDDDYFMSITINTKLWGGSRYWPNPNNLEIRKISEWITVPRESYDEQVHILVEY